MFFHKRYTEGQQIHEKVAVITSDPVMQMRLLPHTFRVAVIKRQEITIIGRDVEKREPFALLVGM